MCIFNKTIFEPTEDTWSFGKFTLSMGLDGVGLGCGTIGRIGPGAWGGGSVSSGGEGSQLCCS